MIISTIGLSPQVPAGDLQAVHGLVLQAALAGEPHRPVLWAQPGPRILVIRHDRAVTTTDLPPGLAEHVTHSPYWLPPAGAAVDWAVTVDASVCGQTRNQWAARNALNLTRGKGRRAEPKPSRIRTPEQVLDVVTARLSGAGLDVPAARAASRRHRIGHRPREGRTLHSNQVTVRGAGTVTDAAALHDLMVRGIGRNKSFGCGLMFARPATVAAPC